MSTQRNSQTGFFVFAKCFHFFDVGSLFLFFGRIVSFLWHVYHVHQCFDVLLVVQQYTFCWFSISTSASCFLVITTNATGWCSMDHKSAIGFIYPHPKCNCCTYNTHCIAHPTVLYLVPPQRTTITTLVKHGAQQQQQQ